MVFYKNLGGQAIQPILMHECPPMASILLGLVSEFSASLSTVYKYPGTFPGTSFGSDLRLSLLLRRRLFFFADCVHLKSDSRGLLDHMKNSINHQ
jgi:hypothetical protein